MEAIENIRRWRLDAWIFHGFRPKNHSKIIKNTHPHPPFSSFFYKQKLFFSQPLPASDQIWAPDQKKTSLFLGEVLIMAYNQPYIHGSQFIAQNNLHKAEHKSCCENRTDQKWKDPCAWGGWATLSKNIGQIGSFPQVRVVKSHHVEWYFVEVSQLSISHVLENTNHLQNCYLKSPGPLSLFNFSPICRGARIPTGRFPLRQSRQSAPSTHTSQGQKFCKKKRDAPQPPFKKGNLY